MKDLIPPQIKDSCKLALPHGLKELMSDISREVLRYQPRNLYQFIADYLSALLITRENLSIASHICSDVAQCSCEPELQYELSKIGVDEDDITPARDIIVKYFEKGEVNESSLILKLLRETNIDEDLLPAVQLAIRNAFMHHEAYKIVKIESSSESSHDDMTRAARHTLELYKRTGPSQEVYSIMADKIQKTYRAYGVRRHTSIKDPSSSIKPTKSSEKGDQGDPKVTRFSKTTPSGRGSADSLIEDPDIAMTLNMSKNRMKTISSTSIAGSFVALPHFKPYSVYEKECLSDLDEYPEKEHAHMDYTADSPRFSMVYDDKEFFRRDKKISFTDTATKLGLVVNDDDYVSMGSNNSNPSSSTRSNSEGSVKEDESRLVYPSNDMIVRSDRSSNDEMESDVIKLDDSDNNDDDILEEI
uniref:RIIa domain-containing protein n=1 Tax=Heliothis virescens TaxID=7102 RepID=A0A2A4K6J1_HELVI